MCPLQRLERLHRLPLDVTVAWRASRGVTVFFRGLRRSTRRTRFWLRALPPCPCPCGRGLRGVPRQDPHLGRKLEMDPLVKFGSPSEYCRGTPPERFFTELRPAGSRRRLGHYTSPGVPRPYGVLVPGAPFCHDQLAPAVGGEEYHFLAGAALGFSQPLGGFSRDDAREPELPRTHASRRRYARNVRGLVPCRRRPWDFPFRAFPSRRAAPPSGDTCFLASSDSTVIRHESPGDLRPVSQARPARAAVAPLRALRRQR